MAAYTDTRIHFLVTAAMMQKSRERCAQFSDLCLRRRLHSINEEVDEVWCTARPTVGM